MIRLIRKVFTLRQYKKDAAMEKCAMTTRYERVCDALKEHDEETIMNAVYAYAAWRLDDDRHPQLCASDFLEKIQQTIDARAEERVKTRRYDSPISGPVPGRETA